MTMYEHAVPCPDPSFSDHSLACHELEVEIMRKTKEERIQFLKKDDVRRVAWGLKPFYGEESYKKVEALPYHNFGLPNRVRVFVPTSKALAPPARLRYGDVKRAATFKEYAELLRNPDWELADGTHWAVRQARAVNGVAAALGTRLFEHDLSASRAAFYQKPGIGYKKHSKITEVAFETKWL